ncbi:putative glycoside hydrolase [Mycolicibacterium neoaurum]|uniref:putative glycoside hydrolase n=1 Tax=Mycolicibacterium neoaurum TaxID=1795 RepID=UPI001F4CFFDB|nr:putative glycoside hydrolase [Mycolicibacterium neoaurum]
MNKRRWDRVPTFAYLDGPNYAFGIPDEQLNLISERISFVILGKWVGRLKCGSSESGSAAAMKQIKLRNPHVGVYFSWSACDYFTAFYKSMERGRLPESYAVRALDFEKNGYLASTHADALFWNTSHANMRNWWVSTVEHEVRRVGYDGVYVDGIKQYILRKEEIGEIVGESLAIQLADGVHSMMADLRDAPGLGRTSIIYNGIKSSPEWPDGGSRFVEKELADGVVLESFGMNSAPSPEPEAMAADMALVSTLDGRGNLVAFTSGEDTCPGSSNALEFGLACFLCCAGENSYFRFSGSDAEAQFRDLSEYVVGPPRTVLQQDRGSMTFRREFECATVEVDLKARESHIQWKV